MNSFEPQQIGKLFILIGLFVVVIGGLIFLLGHLGLFRLPGDLEFGGRNWKVYVPVVSCLIISALLTLLFWIFHYFRS